MLSLEKCIKYIVDGVEEITGLSDFGAFLFSDMKRNYPLNKSIENCYNSIILK